MITILMHAGQIHILGALPQALSEGWPDVRSCAHRNYPRLRMPILTVTIQLKNSMCRRISALLHSVVASCTLLAAHLLSLLP